MARVYSLPPREIRERAYRVGLPRHIVGDFLHHMEKWTASSGMEWTISRLKDVKQDINESFSCRNNHPKYILRSEGVRKVSNDTEFVGVFGSLQRFSLKGVSAHHKVISLLNVYTAFVTEELTMKQKAKFFEAVETPGKELPAGDKMFVSTALVAKRYTNWCRVWNNLTTSARSWMC